MTWIVGFKENEETSTILVEVDECSPKEHTLFLYNVYEKEKDQSDENEDVVDLEKPEQLAKVVGFFAPGIWQFAVQKNIVVEQEDEEEASS